MGFCVAGNKVAEIIRICIGLQKFHVHSYERKSEHRHHSSSRRNQLEGSSVGCQREIERYKGPGRIPGQ